MIVYKINQNDVKYQYSIMAIAISMKHFSNYTKPL